MMDMGYMKRRTFIEITALSLTGAMLASNRVHAEEPVSTEPIEPNAAPEPGRPAIEFVGETAGVTTEGFSDARSCTCILHDEPILR